MFMLNVYIKFVLEIMNIMTATAVGVKIKGSRGDLLSYAEAKKMTSSTLHTHGYLSDLV